MLPGNLVRIVKTVPGCPSHVLLLPRLPLAGADCFASTRAGRPQRLCLWAEHAAAQGDKGNDDGEQRPCSAGGHDRTFARLKAGGRILVAVGLLLSVLVCPLREVAGEQPTSGGGRMSVRVEAGDILDTTLSWIDEEYPGELDPLKVKREPAGAALKALEDVYSELLTERDLDPLLRATALTESPQTGVGMAVVKDSKFPSFLTVTSVFEGSPAQQAGLITAQILEIILYTAFIQ